MSFILLIISVLLVAMGYLFLVITYLLYRNKKINITASDQVLKILDDDNAINLIEDKDAFFSHYNIKRDIVKLKTKTFNSNDIFSVAIASLLSGYSLIKNNIFNYISFIIKEVKFFSFIPLISIIFSYIITSSGDSKIALLLFIVIAIYQYIIYTINTESISKIDILDKDIYKVLNMINKTSVIFFISTLVQIIRLVVIILNI